ncbi:MAG: DNA-3-methyladenine glycosylase 2 family protein [Ruminococcaceae bacterium]|nr:DNA-3-methyladenine glycosylase 2 family protein [Oscillospiraceae bacterium]
MKIHTENKDLIVVCDGCINLDYTLDCGQSFRWEKENNIWTAVAYSKKISVSQKDENTIVFYNTSEEDFEKIWKTYFDLERDYVSIVSRFSSDTHLKSASENYYGIRVLNQEPWEALCSFIISQNNNIPRIKGIIKRLCENFGEDLGDGFFAFPSAEKLKSLTPEDLSPLRAGFRAKYIIDAAKKVSSGEINFSEIIEKDIDFGRQTLRKINGVGPKVAECCLLYGLQKSDAFPIDVWVKRIMAELYEEGLPECAYPEIGIAQQYLFHWRRNLDN